eukprot:RCo053584
MDCVSNTNYYELLGVSRHASLGEIRHAYKQKALELHPDKNPKGEALFKLIGEAHSCLTNPETRRLFDESHFPSERTSRSSRASSFSPASFDAAEAGAERAAPRNFGGRPGGVPRKSDREVFQDIYKFDIEMASKKGGFFRDFGAWRATVEQQKSAVTEEQQARE